MKEEKKSNDNNIFYNVTALLLSVHHRPASLRGCYLMWGLVSVKDMSVLVKKMMVYELDIANRGLGKDTNAFCLLFSYLSFSLGPPHGWRRQ